VLFDRRSTGFGIMRGTIGTHALLTHGDGINGFLTANR
jgi:hypothetical protein